MWTRFLVPLAALGLGGLVAAYVAGPPLPGDRSGAVASRAIEVPLAAGDPGRRRAGALIWAGGALIDSEDPRLGGLSDLRWEDACGRFLALTDTGAWVVLEPREVDGLLGGASVSWLGPIRDTAGRAPASKRAADAEAMVTMADGRTLVWYEQDHRAHAFADISACRPDSLAQPAGPALRMPAMAAWPANGGVEAAASWRDGQILISEGQPGRTGGREGLLLDGKGELVRRLSVPVPPGFAPTAMTPLDPGAAEGPWLLLLRRFSPLAGVSAIVALMELPATGEPTVRELARLEPPLTVDNMEGIAVRREGGARMIYLLSDDNFNPAQRTLLLKFRLDDSALPAAP